MSTVLLHVEVAEDVAIAVEDVAIAVEDVAIGDENVAITVEDVAIAVEDVAIGDEDVAMNSASSSTSESRIAFIAVTSHDVPASPANLFPLLASLLFPSFASSPI